MGYANSAIGYANPDAVTQIANGLSTTPSTYDNNGNVTQKTVDGTTTSNVWDYANRLIVLGSGGATTRRSLLIPMIKLIHQDLLMTSLMP